MNPVSTRLARPFFSNSICTKVYFSLSLYRFLVVAKVYLILQQEWLECLHRAIRNGIQEARFDRSRCGALQRSRWRTSSTAVLQSLSHDIDNLQWHLSLATWKAALDGNKARTRGWRLAAPGEEELFYHAGFPAEVGLILRFESSFSSFPSIVKMHLIFYERLEHSGPGDIWIDEISRVMLGNALGHRLTGVRDPIMVCACVQLELLPQSMLSKLPRGVWGVRIGSKGIVEGLTIYMKSSFAYLELGLTGVESLKKPTNRRRPSLSRLFWWMKKFATSKALSKSIPMRVQRV